MDALKIVAESVSFWNADTKGLDTQKLTLSATPSDEPTTDTQ